MNCSDEKVPALDLLLRAYHGHLHGRAIDYGGVTGNVLARICKNPACAAG